MIWAHSGNSAPSSDTDIIFCHSLPCMLGRGACHFSLPSAGKACNGCLSLLFASAGCHWFLSLCCLQCLQMRPSAAGVWKRWPTINPDYAAATLLPAAAACHCRLPVLPVTALQPATAAATAACHCSLSLQPATAAYHCCCFLLLLPVQCYQAFLPLPSIFCLSLPAGCHWLRWLLPTTVPSSGDSKFLCPLLKNCSTPFSWLHC